jgi:hypothetical protein
VTTHAVRHDVARQTSSVRSFQRATATGSFSPVLSRVGSACHSSSFDVGVYLLGAGMLRESERRR